MHANGVIVKFGGFFFQAEDGIRDVAVTGVQTCALPIYVCRLAYRMTGNRQDAEEVVQEAFLRAYQKLGQFAARANFGTWVYRIAANYAIDRMRQRKKEDTRKLEPAVHEEGTENDPVTLVHDAAPTPERLAHNIEIGRAHV